MTGVTGTGTVGAVDIARAIGSRHAPHDEQIAVIEAPPEGATLVVAGAGSGKTTTMSYRVLWLLANGHATPDEILGLTFTRKAARELRRRIGEFIARLPAELRPWEQAVDREDARLALDVASAPTVSTYNSFGAAVYREHALGIGLDPDAEVLSEAAAWQLARRVVVESRVPGIGELERTLASIVDGVLDLSHELSDNAVDDTGAVLEYAESVLALLDEDVLPLGGGRYPAEVEVPIGRLAGLRVLLPLVAELREAKQRRGLMEFSDQVTSALRIAQTVPGAADAVRERHRFVLLDEYQDTSDVQTRLLAELFRHRPGDERRGIVAVGDPNQSIYGWRGASDANLRDFLRQFGGDGPTSARHLSISWRNPTTVLGAANAIAGPLRSRPGIEVRDLAARPSAPEGLLAIRTWETVEDEAAGTAAWIRSRLEVTVPDEDTGVPVPPTAAVLVRKRKHIAAFAAALESAGVEHRVLGVGGLLETPEVTDVLAALRVLADPDAGSALIRLLAGPRWAVGVADLAALARLAEIVQQQRTGRRDGRSIVDALDALVDARDEWDALEAFSPEGLRRLRDAGATFRALRARLGIPLAELVRLVEEALRLDIEVVANDRRRRGGANLREFRNQIESFVRVDDFGTISSFLAWADRAIADDERIGPADAPREPGVVQLITVHAAKGLEWDVVAIPRLVEGEFPAGQQDALGWLAFGRLPHRFRGDREVLEAEARLDLDGLADRKALRDRIQAYKDGLAERQAREERRLAYVAVTRARRDLLLGAEFWPGEYDRKAKAAAPRRLSGYLTADLADAGLLPADLALESALDADPSDPHAEDLRWPRDPLGRRREAVLLARDRVLAASPDGDAGRWSREIDLLLAERDAAGRAGLPELPARVAASGFKHWVTDPAGVLDGIRRPMPERPYRATRLGTVFHAWVEERYRDLMPEAFFDPDWDGEEEALVGAGAEDAELARLKDAFERSEWATLRPLAIERAIELPFAGRTIPCKIDAVFRRGDRIEIVDWKTGKAPRTDDERAAFDYQLALYRLAWSKAEGVPLEDIDAKAYFVATDETHAPAALPDEAALLAHWDRAIAIARDDAPGQPA